MNMTAMAQQARSTPSETDIIFNRASLALARSQRLVASWLTPASASGERDIADVERELFAPDEAEQEEAVFKAEPEVLGVGATAPDNAAASLGSEGYSVSNEATQWRRRERVVEEKLRLQLLGPKRAKQLAQAHQRNAKNVMHSTSVDGGSPALTGLFKIGSKSMPQTAKPSTSSGAGNHGHDLGGEDDEDAGRTALGRKKRRIKASEAVSSSDISTAANAASNVAKGSTTTADRPHDALSPENPSPETPFTAPQTSPRRDSLPLDTDAAAQARPSLRSETTDQELLRKRPLSVLDEALAASARKRARKKRKKKKAASP